MKLCTGQLVSYEVVDATMSSCPMELVKIPVPDNDTEFCENSSSAQLSAFPFLRSAYDPETGRAPNRPRQPVMHIASFSVEKLIANILAIPNALSSVECFFDHSLSGVVYNFEGVCLYACGLYMSVCMSVRQYR